MKLIRCFRFFSSFNQKHNIKTVKLSFKIIESDVSDEPPVLLFHGLLGTKKYWARLGKTIATLTKRTVVAVDLRNHGYSPHAKTHTYEELAADVLDLYERLEINNASLVGHSMGGRTCMCLALMEPDKVADLIVVDISPISSPRQLTKFPKIMTAMKTLDFQGIKNVKSARKKAREHLYDVIKDCITMRTISANIRLKEDGTIGWMCNLDTLIEQFHSIASFPQYLLAKKYLGPTMFIGGQLSDFIPADDLPGIREIFPRAVIKYILKGGHNLHIDNTKTFLEFAIAFLKYESAYYK